MLANRRHSITEPPERKNGVSGPEKLHSGDGGGSLESHSKPQGAAQGNTAELSVVLTTVFSPVEYINRS